jgi:nicotinamide riboside transporter PnuC
MTDILIRLCVGVCGLLAVVAAMNAMRGSKQPLADSVLTAIVSLIGLITILRALGVL